MREKLAIRPFMRKLLLIELLVSFAPIVCLFLVALMAGWMPLWLLLCGFSGLFALTRVVTWLLRNSGDIEQPIFVSCGMVLGLLPIIDVGLGGSVGWQFLAALPILATCHIAVACRTSLFRWLRRV